MQFILYIIYIVQTMDYDLKSICNEVSKLTKKSIQQPIPSKSALQQKRETQNNLSMSYSDLLEIAAHFSLKVKTKKKKKSVVLKRIVF